MKTKTYVVCIDGTWNSPLQMDQESITETNVLRIFRFLTGVLHPNTLDRLETTRPLNPQFSGGGNNDDLGAALYLPGVGSSGRFVANRWEGATGAGTMERILLAYGFLAEHCQEGDRIFAFGFSRGAFAVRSLAGLINHVGLPTVPRLLDPQELHEVSRSYRERTPPTPVQSTFRPADVEFLGLWDTVGALAFETFQGKFHDLSPSNVRRVAHALALDEQREVFEPEYWAGSGTSAVVKEVWFSGVHSNVGGGYVNAELANVALAWVVSEAVEAGLPTQPAYIDGWYRENSFGIARNSHKEFLRHLGVLAGLFKGRPRALVPLNGQSIHASVFDRIEEAVSDYSTGNLGKPQGWEPYIPAARLNGKPLPNQRTAFTGKIFETPDYLPGSAKV
jgi:hypothetical protein